MSKAHAIMKSLKQLFAEMEPVASDTTTVYKLKDGTEISVSKLDVGGSLMISGMPAPANTYELEDGTSIVVDEAGLILSVTKATAAAAPAPADPVKSSSQKFEITDDLKTAEGLRKLTEAFATGTPEERLFNLELVAKALMEYSFGWEIRKAKEEADRQAAIKVYTDQLAATQNIVETQKQTLSQMFTLLEEVVGLPTEEPPAESKAAYSFTKTEAKNKSLERYQKALQALKPATQQTN